MYPYNFKFGQTIQTDADGVSCDQVFLAHFQVQAADATAPAAASLLAATGLTTATQAVITAITSPAAPRNVSITGNAAGIAGDVVVKGTNYAGEAITETIALSGTTTVVGNKAFKTVTEIDLPIKTNASGDTVSVGIGAKLGLPYKLAHNTVIKTFLDNVAEGTAPTVTADAANIEGNTIALATALSGKIIDSYLLA